MTKNKNNQAIWNTRIKKSASNLFQKIGNSIDIDKRLYKEDIQGSIAHGIGNAILEDMQYDDQAQPITTNFGEYLLPTATDIPKVEMHHLFSPSPLNPLGVKGAGEGGTIPAAAAIVSAIEDAISDTGIFLTQAPMTPPRLFEILNKSNILKTTIAIKAATKNKNISKFNSLLNVKDNIRYVDFLLKFKIY